MKYYLKNFFLILICNNLNAADKYEGHGPLTLKNVDVNIFKEYMSPPAGHSPSAFYVLIENGEVIWSTYWYCPAGNCQTHVKSRQVKDVELLQKNITKDQFLKIVKDFR